MAIGPLVLLSDSQLLLSTEKGRQLSDWVSQCMAGRPYVGRQARALYLGASNDNVADFYQMAVAACAGWGVTDVVHGCEVSDFAEQPVATFDVVVLSGGDVERGWQFLSQPVVRQWLRDFSEDGGVIVGVSAGAIHLASTVSLADQCEERYLNFFPACIAVHEESLQWPTRIAWQRMQGSSPVPRLLCIPFGGGVAIRADMIQPMGEGVDMSSRESG